MNSFSKLLLSFLFFSLLNSNAFADWSTCARRLTGESDRVRNQCIAELKKTKGLEDTLKKELVGTRKLLSLDVISTLKIQALLPDLIRLTETASDESGFFYLSINALLNSFNQKQISDLYQKRLMQKNTSAVAKMILLDTLLRMGSVIEDSDLRTLLFKSDSPEAQSAALYYLRGRLLHSKDASGLVLLKKFIGDKPKFQRLNQQAVFALNEFCAQGTHQKDYPECVK